MRLEQVRQAKTIEGIESAIRHWIAIGDKLTYGEYYAYKNTIVSSAKKLGISNETLTTIAKKYLPN